MKMDLNVKLFPNLNYLKTYNQLLVYAKKSRLFRFLTIVNLKGKLSIKQNNYKMVNLSS